MGILALTADERVVDVSFAKDTFSVSLQDRAHHHCTARLVSEVDERVTGRAQELANCRRRLRNPLA